MATNLLKVYTGAVWESCPLVEVATVEAASSAVAEAANVSPEIAEKALSNPGIPVLAGWVIPAEGNISAEPPTHYVQIDVGGYGDPVYAPTDWDGEDVTVVAEPFYVCVEST